MKRYILAVLTALTLTFAATVPAGVAYADSVSSAESEICKSIKTQANASCGSGANTLEKIFTGVLNILSVIVGLAAVIMIIVAGLKYVTSSGDSNAIGEAKRTLLYAIIGLIVAALSQFIVRFVLSEVTFDSK
jgi:hypothetical protein